MQGGRTEYWGIFLSLKQYFEKIFETNVNIAKIKKVGNSKKMIC